ncbi:hypothetical protein EON65_01325 [archaeon]|nr:MAG: hypothetical protein EON65_01325 [archaeon]
MLIGGGAILNWLAILIIVFANGRLASGKTSVQFSSPGSYSLFSPKIKKSFIPIVNDDVKGLKKIEVNSEILEDHYDTNIDSEFFLSAISTLLSSRKDKYVRFLVKDDILILSIKSWPMGWKNYAFLIKFVDDGLCEDTVGEIEFVSLTGKKDTKRRMKVVLTMETNEQKQLLISTLTSYGKMSRGEAETVTSHLLFYMKGILREAYKMSTARLSLMSRVKKASTAVAMEKKKQALDRIIHPEKCKTKSSTIKRTSNSGGSGRYTPSAATQARRQINKGG